jgi:hypothetical protein
MEQLDILCHLRSRDLRWNSTKESTGAVSKFQDQTAVSCRHCRLGGNLALVAPPPHVEPLCTAHHASHTAVRLNLKEVLRMTVALTRQGTLH